MLESVQDDCRVLRHYLQALFLVDSVAERNFAGNDSAMLYLAVQDDTDSFPAQVRFVLRNGEAEVDIQPPACRGGVVLLLGGQPTAFVGVQNLHDLVIIGHRTKPAIQTGKEDQVYLVLLHVLQHPQEVGALAQPLAGRLCRVDINANDHPAAFPGVLLQVLLLGLQRQALNCLFLAADTDIQINAQRGRCLVFCHK